MRNATMRISAIISGLVAFLPFALADPAPNATNQPVGVQYVAILPNNKVTTGSVMIAAAPGGDGVSVQVSFAGLPTEGGPFLYHIHEKYLDSTGNCSSAGGHLNPYHAPATCNKDQAAQCEVGDLSGKHGKVEGTSFSANYIENYVSVKPDPDPQSVQGRTLVVHYANKTAITCANFTLNGGNGSTSSSTAVTTLTTGVPLSNSSTSSSGTSTTGTASSTSNLDPFHSDNPTTTPEAGGGTQAAVGMAAALAGVAAFAL